MIKIEKISINNIIDDRSKLPEDFNKEKWEELARSFSRISILELIIVQAIKDGYLLLTGHRRLEAVQKTNKETTSVIVVDDYKITDEDIDTFKNLQPEEMDPLERAIVIQNYIEKENITKVEASERLNIPRTTLNYWLVILEFSEKYQRAVLNDFYGKRGPTLSLSHLEQAKQVRSNAYNPEVTKRFLDVSIKYDLTRREATKIRDLLKKHHSLDIEEAGKIIKQKINLKDKRGDFKKNPLMERTEEITADFEEMREELKDLLERSITKIDDETEIKLLNEFMLIYQTLNEVTLEALGISLEEAKEKFDK